MQPTEMKRRTCAVEAQPTEMKRRTCAVEAQSTNRKTQTLYSVKGQYRPKRSWPFAL